MESPEKDEDRPWTASDFARAEGPDALGAAELAAFPKTAARIGRPRKVKPKQAVSLRLDPAVLEHYRAGGPGWQSRINAALLETLGRKAV